MTTRGRGFGKQVVTYEDLNILRAGVFTAENYANIMRGRRGMQTVFRQVLPPVVTTGNVRVGCGRLPDPTCLTSFEFTATIDKSRKIDEIAERCDVELAGELMTGYTDTGSARWANHEAKELFAFVDSKATEAVLTTTNNRIEEIEQMVLQLEDILDEQMGDLAPDRTNFIVLVNTKVESELRALNFSCCALSDQTKSSTADYYGVQQVTVLNRSTMPTGTDIIVYVPKFVFGLTMCEYGFTQGVMDNVPGYRPDTIRFFGEEDYGFEQMNYSDGTINVIIDFAVNKPTTVEV